MELNPEELKAEREASLQRQNTPNDPEEVVAEPGPVGRVLGAERADAARPYAEEVRNALFETRDPPFESVDDPDLQSWDSARLRRALDGVPTEEDRAFDDAVDALTAATGFKARDVWEWVLCGTPPALPRATYTTRDRKEKLPDGTVIRRRFARLTFHAPIRDEELRRIYRERIRPMWDQDVATDALRRRGKEITDLDHHLSRLMEETPDATWRERLAKWKKTPPKWWESSPAEWREEHGNVTSGALRVRWHRLQEKLDDLQPEED